MATSQMAFSSPGSRRRWRRTLHSPAKIIGFAVLAVWCLFPPFWMLVSSFKDSGAILDNSLIPLKPVLTNFVTIFSQSNFLLALRNSVIIAGTTTVVTLAVALLAAYALAGRRFRGRRLAMIVILAASMFPAIAIVTPLFQVFSDLGWVDHYQSMIIPDVAFGVPFGVWVLTTFLSQLPWELEEAAKIDGASDFQSFSRVMLPLAAPGVFTTAILVFVMVWNEFLIASAMSISPTSQPVTVAIAQFSGVSQYEQPYGPQMAAGVIVTIPLIILVLVFQRRIVQGLTTGGLK